MLSKEARRISDCGSLLVLSGSASMTPLGQIGDSSVIRCGNQALNLLHQWRRRRAVDAPKARPCPGGPALRFGHQAARCCAAGMHSPAQSQRRPDRLRSPISCPNRMPPITRHRPSPHFRTSMTGWSRRCSGSSAAPAGPVARGASRDFRDDRRGDRHSARPQARGHTGPSR